MRISKRIFSSDIVQISNENWLNEFPASMEILTDNGTQFNSDFSGDFLKQNGIKQINAAIQNPTCNGIVERLNSLIMNTLRCLSLMPLHEAIKITELALQISYHRTLGTSPATLLQCNNILNPLNIKPETTNIIPRMIQNLIKNNKQVNRNRLPESYLHEGA